MASVRPEAVVALKVAPLALARLWGVAGVPSSGRGRPAGAAVINGASLALAGSGGGGALSAGAAAVIGGVPLAFALPGLCGGRLRLAAAVINGAPLALVGLWRWRRPFGRGPRP